MKTRWQVHRTVRAQSAGERRWDYAYQFLLQWTINADAGTTPVSAAPQEEPYGSRSLCPCLYNSSTVPSDDRPAARTAPCTCHGPA
jgi:hypothetical protein